MRLGILINDAEYRTALVERIVAYDNDLFVNIIDASDPDASDCLILTDASPLSLGSDDLAKIADRTVFLTSSRTSDENPLAYKSVFKYSNVSDILSELSIIYNGWRGSGSSRSYSAKIIAVCCESDMYSHDKCLSLARQIIYRAGGSVLIMSLGYINDYGSSKNDGSNRFARLMYSIESGREGAARSFTETDGYDVSVLMLPQGSNPVAYLDEDELKSVVSGLALYFNSIVLDIGTCFRKENLIMMNDADSIICFEAGRRNLGLEDMLNADSIKKLKRIRLSGETEEMMAIDDCIREMYGVNSDENN